MSIRQFFPYYGAKWRIATRYPEPDHAHIVEPFAGSAGYALRYPSRAVTLIDSDEIVAGTWAYLLAASEAEIRALPLWDGSWDTTDDLRIPQEARWLIGWWLNKGVSSPRKSPSAWMRQGIRPNSMWGEAVRDRIARQVGMIRHWRILHGPHTLADAIEPATWFVDPPYELAGKHYRHGSSGIDYADLAAWCRSRVGQVIVCEQDGATWLPFDPHVDAKGTEGAGRSGRSAEVVWIGGAS